MLDGDGGGIVQPGSVLELLRTSAALQGGKGHRAAERRHGMLDFAGEEEDVEHVDLQPHDQQHGGGGLARCQPFPHHHRHGHEDRSQEQHREGQGALAQDAVDERHLVAPGLYRVPGIALHACMRPVFQGELAEGLQGANGVQQHVVAVGLHRGHLVGHGGDIPHGAADEGVEQTTHRYEEQRISGVNEDHHERGQRQHEEREHEAVTHHGDGHDHGVDVLG